MSVTVLWTDSSILADPPSLPPQIGVAEALVTFSVVIDCMTASKRMRVVHHGSSRPHVESHAFVRASSPRMIGPFCPPCQTVGCRERINAFVPQAASQRPSFSQYCGKSSTNFVCGVGQR